MKLNFSIFALVCIIFVTSCDSDDPDIANEEELITTVTLTLTPNDTKEETVEVTYEDLDGDGGTEATITTGTLVSDMQYDVSIELLNELESPAEDITAEVEEEADDHQFFFVIEEDLDLTYSYNDEDSDGNPIGLSTSWVTGNASSGAVTVILRHEPTKPNDGLSDAGGETDIEIDFEFTIE